MVFEDFLKFANQLFTVLIEMPSSDPTSCNELLSPYFRCDGIPDCEDGADEANCSKLLPISI